MSKVKRIKVGLVGLGQRGGGLMTNILSMKEVVGIELTAIPFYVKNDTPIIILDNQKISISK